MAVKTSNKYCTKLRDKRQITLPTHVQEALGVQEGEEIEFEVSPLGVVEVHGLKRIRSDQAWFWTPQWQAGEREAAQDIKAGRVTSYPDNESFLASLEGDV